MNGAQTSCGTWTASTLFSFDLGLLLSMQIWEVVHQRDLSYL